MYSITDLKKDTVIQLEGVPFKVVDYAQKQMGRGGSIVNVKLKNLLTGAVLDKTFKGNEKIDSADVTNKKMQFLYAESNKLNFMDEETYEQFEVDADLVSNVGLLKEGTYATLQQFEGRVINIDLPIKVPLKVIEAPDVVKGDTQSTVMKTVVLETGIEVQTPMFVKQGDTIIVDTRDASYVERQK
jgi:elongation factor P